MKTEAERNAERATIGAMLVLLGIVALIRLPGRVFPTVAAAILLGSAYYQRQQGWAVSIWTWLFGVVFAVWAVLSFIGGVFSFLWNLWPLILIALGVMLLVNLYTGRR